MTIGPEPKTQMLFRSLRAGMPASLAGPGERAIVAAGGRVVPPSEKRVSRLDSAARHTRRGVSRPPSLTTPRRHHAPVRCGTLRDPGQRTWRAACYPVADPGG